LINDFRLYALTVVTNFFDIGVGYFLIHNLVTPRANFLIKTIEARHPPLSVKIICMGIVYSIIVGYPNYLFPGNLIIRIIGVIAIIGLIKFFTKDKLYNAIMIYAVTVLIIAVIQTPIGLLLFLIDISEIHLALIGGSLTLCASYLLYQKVVLHKTFAFIKRNFRLSSLLISGIIAVLISFAAFYLSWQNQHHVWAVASIIITIAVISIYLCIIYAMRLQLKMHNMKNLLEGIEYLLKTEQDRIEVYNHYDKTLKNNGFIIPKNTAYKPGKYKENLIEFINHKKVKHQSKAKCVTDIKFYYQHHKVPIPVMIQMLGTLLDNAFETKTKKPIFINMTIVGSQLEIKVSNASDNKSPIEIDYMFSEGYSKKTGEHGYGLSSLAKMVKDYDGIIIANCDYNKIYNCHYLTLILEFKNDH